MMAGKAITLRERRACDHAQVPPRLGVRMVAAFALIQLLLLPALTMLWSSVAGAAPISSDLKVSTSGGYARLVFTMSEETEAEVRVANGIAIITFKRPVEVRVDRLAQEAPGYINAARSDPDGTGVRLALGRKVTVNMMAAGEKLFVDLLPENWTGLPPGLPQDVVEELARRAREAEKKARQQLQLAQRTPPTVRVRVGIQPTFTRYIFALPSLTPVTADRSDDKLTLTFETALRMDLADAQASLPPTVAAIEAEAGNDAAVVRFAFIGKVDVRSFREDNNYIIDVQPAAGRNDATLPTPAQAAKLAAAQSQPKATPKTQPPTPAAPAAVQATAPPEPPKPEPARASVASANDKPAAPPAGIVASKEAAPQPPTQPAAQPKPAPPETAPAREAEPQAPLRRDPSAPIVVDARRHGDALRLTFPFHEPTPAAVFRRSDTIWLVFDSVAPIDVAQVVAQSGRTIRSVSVSRSNQGQVVQLKLDRPKLTSVGSDSDAWTVTIGDTVLDPTRPLNVVRAVAGTPRASATIPFEDPKRLHRVADTEVGDTLLVVTALGPARGFLNQQDFVEFRALVSIHGVAVQPIADDVTMELDPDKIVVLRPNGLTLSSAGARPSPKQANASIDGARRGHDPRAYLADPQAWGFDRQADYRERQSQLARVAAEASGAQQLAARLELARFYLAREMYAEAKGVLDIVAADERAMAEDPSVLALRGIVNVMLRRGQEALRDLSHPAIGNRFDAPVLRAMALTQQGKWVEAREGFRSLEASNGSLPVELQRRAYKDALLSAIEVRDFGEAGTLLNEFDTLGVPPEMSAEIEGLKARTLEGLGRPSEALTSYAVVAESRDKIAAAQARLREIVLRNAQGDLKPVDAIAALDKLVLQWRGDETEAEALLHLARFNIQEGRHRDAFRALRTALTVHPHSEFTRKLQDDCAASFDELFMTDKGDGMSAIDALSLFYDFKELTPVGRRGDEMIRKLADRLASIDLLEPAAELLQHQIDNRLQGAARAQVAVRLTVIYLMARKPDRAIQVLRATRVGDLPAELRNQRLLIEARALSDIGRPDIALEVVSNIEGREAERLRADVLWKARRWRQASEQIERLYGDRWRDFAPLTPIERADILRAAIGYALGEDPIGLDRFREKYAPKMADGPDRRAFDVVTAPANSGAPEFGDVAKSAAAADTLDNFLRDIRARFPESGSTMPARSNVPQNSSQAPAPGRAG